MPYDKPSAEVELDDDVVRRLLADQCPQWLDEPVAFLLAGWDNAMFVIGDDKLARVPRRASAVPLIEHEQRWLPELAPRLPLPIPAPLHAGTPTSFYPWPWSIVPLAVGRSALEVSIDTAWSTDGIAGSAALADRVGTCVAALHEIPVPESPPVNPYRGIPLADRNDLFDQHLADCGRVLDGSILDAIRDKWADALAAPPPAGRTWLHGDLHPGNLIVDTAGAPVSLIDFGDMCAGDPAVDLMLGWQLFTPDARPAFRVSTRVDDATWARGRGWALAHGVACLANSADDPAFTALGRHTIDAVVTD